MASKVEVNQNDLVSILSEYLKKNPNDHAVYSLLGSSHRAMGQPLKALKIHKNLMAKPDLKKKFKQKVRMEFAKDLYANGNYSKALEVLKDILRYDSKNSEAMLLSLKIFRKNAEHEEALKTAERLPNADPKLLSDVYTEYASSRLKANDTSKAKKFLKKAVSKWPANMDALIMMGDAELKDGRSKSAIDSYFRAIETNSTYTPLILERIENALFQSNKFDELSVKLREELSGNVDNSDIHYSLGKFLLKKGLPDEARKEFKRALEFNPTHFEAREELVNILLEENKTTGAIKKEFRDLFGEIKKNLFYYCTKCGNREKEIKWKCPSCNSFNSYERSIFLF